MMLQVNTPDWDDVFIGAALEPDRWHDALGQLAGQTRSTHGQLIGVGRGRARDVPFNIASDFKPAWLEQFIEMGGASPTLNYRIAANNAGVARGDYDSVLHEEHSDAVMPVLQSDRYVQFCDEVDIPFGCQTNLVVDRPGLIGLAILRNRKEGRTKAEQRQVFAHAAQAGRRAVRLQERLEGDQARLLAWAFDAIQATAFILDVRGRVQTFTQGAEAVVATGDVVLHNQTLTAAGTPMSLERAVAALVADDGLQHVRLRLDCGEARPPLFVEGFRLPARSWSRGYLPHAILLVKTPQRDRAGIAAFLTLLYGFTASDADIAMRLYDGASRQDIAQIRRVTPETLRGQIKAICGKTDARHEADLMRRLAAVMA